MFKRLLLLIGVLPLLAHASVTALIGGSHFTPHSDGVWYQEAFPYELKLTSPSLGLRIDKQITPALGIGAGVLHLGKVSSSAIATGIDGLVAGDRGYNPNTKTCNGPCGYLSHWYGSGSVTGLFAVGSYTRGPWSADAGLFLYKPQWRMRIPDWVGECRECPPISLDLTNRALLNVGPVFGFRYLSGPWSVNAHAWYTKTRGGEPISLYHKFTYSLMLGYTF